MSISRLKALDRLGALGKRVREHLARIAAEPDSRAVLHLMAEVESSLAMLERIVPHVGKKTGKLCSDRIAEWRARIMQ